MFALTLLFSAKSKKQRPFLRTETSTVFQCEGKVGTFSSWFHPPLSYAVHIIKAYEPNMEHHWKRKINWPSCHISQLTKMASCIFHETHDFRMLLSGFSPSNLFQFVFMKPPALEKSHICSLVNDCSGSNADGCDILKEPHNPIHTPDISIFSLTDQAPERNKSWHGIIPHFLSCQPFFEGFLCFSTRNFCK